jgi:putative ABC transport system ATP-binding protein
MGSKKYSAIGAIQRVTELLRGDWRDVGVIIVYAVGVGLCSLVFPVAVKSLVNTVAFGTLMQPVIVLTALVGGVLVFAGTMRVFQLYAVELLQRRLITRLGLTLAARIPHIHLGRFSEKFGPEYVLRFFEVFQVQKALAVLLLDGVSLFFQVSLGLTLVSFYHPYFLAFALVLVCFVCFSYTLLGWGGVRTAVEESDAKYDVVTWLQDLASTATVFKSYAGESYAANRADQLISKYLSRRSTHFRIICRIVIVSLVLQAITSAALLGLGGWLVIEGRLTLGQLVAAELVFNVILMSVAKMGKNLEVFYDMSAGVAKLDAILDLPYEDLTGSMMGVREAPAQLRIEDVSLAPPGSAPTLVNASLDIKPGEKVAIWGGNGSGKSHLANIVYRLTEPEKGRVRLDEFNVSTIHPKELRDEITLIRNIEIFHGTIRDNLTVGRASVTDTHLRTALDLVGLSDEIYSLPLGIDTVLRGTAAPLSRGQALRLMVARGLLARPRLLILDGTIDQIDEQSRKRVLLSLLGNDCPFTTVVLTHEEDILSLFPKAYRIAGGTFAAVSQG